MKPGARQLPLDIGLAPRYGEEDFLVAQCNAQAWEMVGHWPDWPDRVLLLIGPEGAGKSHLGAIWAQRVGARKLAATDLSLPNLPSIARESAVLIEDVDSASGEAELFHLLNLARESGAYLLLTARTNPDVWGLAMPDLLSRLRRAPFVAIGAPDEALVRAVLVKLFLDRQLLVDESVIDFLSLRLERSFEAARRIVAALDREALAQARAVTRPMASKVLLELSQAAVDSAAGETPNSQ